MNKDRIRGMFLGVAIGDALGCPVESWSAEKIKEKHGRITTYLDPKGHKYHDGLRAGDITDDTNLTLAVAEGLIAGNGFNLDKIAEQHVLAYHEDTNGWGPTTREAIKKLSEGVSWKDSGVYEPVEATGEGFPSPRGFGNGVAMKVSPIGALLAIKSYNYKEVAVKMADLAAMTHRTSMAVSSGLAQVFAVSRCLSSKSNNFSTHDFVASVVAASDLGKNYFRDTLKDDISEKFRSLFYIRSDSTNEDFIRDYGKGGVYVYHSLPFAYAFFVRNPRSIESLFDCVSSGGDADSTGSILGALLGSLHGTKIFPKYLIDGLQEKDKIIAVADRFSETFV